MAAIAAALLSVPGSALSEPITQTIEEHRNDRGEIDRLGDRLVHRSSGYVFPAALGEMQARQTTTYGAGDASVYYTLAGGANADPWLTLYVYPVTTEWSAEIAGVEGSIVQRMNGKPIPMPQGLPRATSGTAEKWFDGTVDGVPVTTGYRLVRQGNWYLKVRLSIPVSGGEAGLRRAWGALAAVPWSMPVSGERRPVASSVQGNPAGAARTGDR